MSNPKISTKKRNELTIPKGDTLNKVSLFSFSKGESMSEELHKYIYDGPVYRFKTLVAEHWKGETMAPSESKARNNLIYQYKSKHHRRTWTHFTLTGEIKKVY